MKGNYSTSQGFIFTQGARYVERETVNCSMCLCVHKNICTYARAIPCVYADVFLYTCTMVHMVTFLLSITLVCKVSCKITSQLRTLCKTNYMYVYHYTVHIITTEWPEVFYIQSVIP